MSDDPHEAPAARASRRTFLRAAGALAAGAAAATVAGCDPAPSGGGASTGGGAARAAGFDRTTLDAVGEVVLPAALGAAGRRGAVDAFVAWVDGYDPVAEEMHGYGYSDVRFLPPDPAPAWRAQLAGLDLLAQRSRGKRFVELDEAARRDVVTAALARERGERLPDPLSASHVAVALLAHWARSPEAWNLALGVQVSPGACRSLDGVTRKPLPIAGAEA